MHYVVFFSLSPAALWADIEAANVKFMDAFKTGDATQVAKLYTEDCKVMPTGADVQLGRDGKLLEGRARTCMQRISTNQLYNKNIHWCIIKVVS